MTGWQQGILLAFALFVVLTVIIAVLLLKGGRKMVERDVLPPSDGEDHLP